MTSLSTRRAGARNGARLAERAIAEAKAHIARREAEHQVRIRAEVERQRQHNADLAAAVTDEQMRGARLVRLDTGWHRLVRVSAKSITVNPLDGWPDYRVPRIRVLETRA